MTKTYKREAILEEFSVEERHDEATLRDYVKRYPEYAADLMELFAVISNLIEEDRSLTEHDANRIESAWARLQQPVAASSSDLLDRLKTQAPQIAQALGVPRQVITAFRERRIDATTVPRRIIVLLAQQIEVACDELKKALAGPPLNPARQFLADHSPRAPTSVSFAQVLRQAKVSDERIEELLEEDC